MLSYLLRLTLLIQLLIHTTPLSVSRGQFLRKCAATIPITLLAPEVSYAASSTSSPPVILVLVLGGSGRTGMSCTEVSLKTGYATISTTRSGSDPFKVVKLPLQQSELYTFGGAVDVKSVESISRALDEYKPTHVIYAASASKKGGNAKEIDYLGVANTAEAMKNRKAKLTLISALALDQPESKGYKMTNSMGGYVDGILDYKLMGEKAVTKGLGKDAFTIIRPGVLLGGKGQEPTTIEVNEGDRIGGGLTREELANVVVGSIGNEKSRGRTVEVYRKSTRTTLMPDYDAKSGKERGGETWTGIWD